MHNVSLMSCEEILQVLSLSGNATAIYKTADIIIQSANDAMIAFWGKDKSVIGKPIAQAVPELIGQPFIDILKQVWNTGETYIGKDTPAFLKRDGELDTHYFDFEYRAILNPDGSVFCILHTATEVTERMQAWKTVREKEVNEQSLNENLMAINEEYQAQNEELSALNEEYMATNEELSDSRNYLEIANFKLRESEERFRHLIQKAPTGIAILTGNNLIFEIVNDRMFDLLERDHSIIGLPFVQAMDKERYGAYISLLQQVLKTGESYQGNGVKITKKHGDFSADRYINYVYEPILEDNGKVGSIMIVATEVTELVMAKAEMQRATEKLALAIDAAGLGTWRVDPQTKQLGYNQTLANIYGYKEVIPMSFDTALSLVSDEHRERVSLEIDHAIAENRNYDISYAQHRHSDNSLVWLRSIGKVMQDEDGRGKVLAGIVMDITEQKHDEERKNDFIGMVSHELKTPLTSLAGYIQLLERKANKNEDSFAIGALEKAGQQVKKMTGMINGFLNVSRLESGKIQLNKTTFMMDKLVSEIVAESKLLSSEYDFIFHPCDPIEIYADREKISSVLTNLISNAVKYSPNSRMVEIECSVDNDEVTLRVLDKGMGISEDHLARLFDRFYRVEENNSKSISGFGIGLYLSAEIISRHGGKIWAESILGEGSVFIFNLPVG